MGDQRRKEKGGNGGQWCWISRIINPYVVYSVCTGPVTLHMKTQSLQQNLYEINTIILHHYPTDQETKVPKHYVLKLVGLMHGRGRILNSSILAAKSCLLITMPYCLSEFFLSFQSCTHGTWRFPGSGSVWSHSCQPMPQPQQCWIRAASCTSTAT